MKKTADKLQKIHYRRLDFSSVGCPKVQTISHKFEKKKKHTTVQRFGVGLMFLNEISYTYQLLH